MARKNASFDAWPLLPRGTQAGRSRPEDEPARAAATIAVMLAALFLPLRNLPHTAPLADEMALLIALIGCKASFAVTVVTLALVFGAAMAAPIGFPSSLRTAALGLFDHLVHLALVLTVSGVLGVVVLHGQVSEVALWFTFQALLLVACHRARLWLTDRSAA